MALLVSSLLPSRGYLACQSHHSLVPWDRLPRRTSHLIPLSAVDTACVLTGLESSISSSSQEQGQADSIEFQVWGASPYTWRRQGPHVPLQSQRWLCACAQLLLLSLGMASCCLKQKDLTAPSAAHSTGMNFANNLFNHVYELSVHLLQVGFSAMMKRFGCEASRLSFSISASWCGLPLTAVFFPPSSYVHEED